MLSCMNRTDYVSVSTYCLVYDVNKLEEKPRWKETVILYRHAAECKTLNIKTDLHKFCYHPQQIILILSVRATCFGHTDHLQTFKCIILKLKTQGIYTGCPRRNVKYFGRVFLMLNYTDITQNTYIQSWTVTEIMAREVWKYDSCYTLTDYQIHIKTAGICGFCNVNICT